ncbi:MAG TPA: outer membrane beta-barrel protein [Candidatus Nitrosotenuis sp.]|nr:outer membrane beta-barrel protein [Candidatus Nitrosotenuis sp.]
MKHFIYLMAVFSILISVTVCSQTVRTFGLKAGLVNSGQTWKYSGTFAGFSPFDKRVSSVGLSGFVEWLDIPFLSIVTEIGYIHKAAADDVILTSETSPEGIGTKTVKPGINYLTIPLLLKVHYGLPVGTAYIIGGSRYDIMINKNEDAKGAVFDDFKTYDFGYIIGAGYELPINLFNPIALEARYSPSIQKIYSSDKLSVKNNTVEVMLVLGL